MSEDAYWKDRLRDACRGKDMIKHAISNDGEFMLCGMAFDELDDNGKEIVQAKLGETVTCKHCRAVIDHVCKRFSKYNYGYIPNEKTQGKGDK